MENKRTTLDAVLVVGGVIGIIVGFTMILCGH